MCDPYSSHISVLSAVLKAEQPKRVLEYGGGPYSTGVFLRHESVGLLVTVETDPNWRARLEELFPDPAHRMTDSGYPDATAFDLIFIDDGTNADERLVTINHVLSKPHPTVVIHDANVPQYAAAIEEWSTNYKVHLTGPDTAVIQATDTGVAT